MNRSQGVPYRVALLALLACLVSFPAPGHAATGSVAALIAFQTSGSGNPELYYRFDGYHAGEITSYPPLAAPLPATFQGALLKGSSAKQACNGWSTVKNANFSCTTWLLTGCPIAEGTWKARSRMSAPIPPFGNTWSINSGPVFASCPPPIEPPGCSGAYQATKLLAVDLDTGRVTRPEWHFEAPQGLTRFEEVGAKTYFREEWALVSTAGPAQTVTLAAASDAARARVDSYAATLVGASGFDSEHRYLVIEAARHVGHRVEPLVRLRSLGRGRPLRGLSDGRVTFRAAFSPHGSLEGVETLEGSERTARTLAEDLRVEFPVTAAGGGHDDHRAVVFASFEVESGRSRFVSAIPVLPQCCCGPNYCI
jgi:hypothetical protein